MAEGRSNTAHVPMGSVGSGCIRIDPVGNLYNDILHPIGEGPLMPFSFPVMRVAAGKAAPYICTLRGSATPAKEPGAKHVPDHLAGARYQQQGGYPVLTGQLNDPKMPVRGVWTYFAPLAPFDHVASVMPCMLASIRVANVTKLPVTCSLMFCMDNLTTEPSDTDAPKPAQIHCIRVEPTANDNRSHLGTSLFRGSIAEAPPDLLKSYIRNALLFGDRRNTSSDARPHLCLGAREQLGAEISLGVWDPASETSADHFWNAFYEKGQAPAIQPNVATRVGAVCCAAKIAPGKSHRFDFLFAWHVPAHICEQMGFSNGYMQHFPNAPESVRYGLRHFSYLYSAVNNWQKQVTDSGLPARFTDALVRSTRAFVTHTRHTAQNGFVLHAKPNNGAPDTLWDFVRAVPLLAFAPRFHAAAVTTALTRLQEQRQTMEKADPNSFLQQCAELILSAYADALYTGNRSRLRNWYPRIMSLVDSGISKLLEKAAAGNADVPLNATTLGLWAVAVNVIILMAKQQGNSNSEQALEALRTALAAAYEDRLIDMTHDTANDDGVLAGVCCAEMLNLNPPATPPFFAGLIAEHPANVATAVEDETQRRRRQSIAALAKALYAVRTEDNAAGGADALESFLAELLNDSAAKADNKNVLSPDRLDLWAVLQSLSGIYYDSLHQSLIVRPSGLVNMDVPMPVFTPVSLGKMDMHLEQGPEKILTVRIAMETPLSVATVALRLPLVMRRMRAACVHDGDTVTASQELLPGNEDTRMVLRFKTPLKLTGMFTVRLRQITSEKDASIE